MTPANAQCLPDPAASGQTVTCSGNDPDGFDANFVNNLTVKVVPGATVSDGGAPAAINVFDFNTIINSGTLAAGSGADGIFAGTNNTITNAATGVITVVNNGFGIYVAGDSTVTNAGAITVGPTPGMAGIWAILHNNTIVNAAGATITAGSGTGGISVQGDDATVSNAGSVVTIDAPGLSVQGNRAVITNSGTTTTGVGGVGVFLFGSNGTITNTISGNIVGGNNATGIAVRGDSITITNRGTITVGNDSGFGFTIGIASNTLTVGGINNIVNTGTINVGTNARGILVTDDGTVFNSGTINALTGVAAIQFCACSSNSSLTLGPGSAIQGLVLGSGTERFQLGGTGSDTFNLSLIGVQYNGFATFNKVDSSNWTVIGNGAQNWNVLGGTLTVNGTINGLVAVNAGGTLAGTGSVGDTNIGNGGALAPGNGTAGSSLTVSSLAFQSGALYLVTLNSTASTFANVIGNAALGGTVVASFTAGSMVLPRYKIMDVGSSTGNFNGVDAPGGLVGTVSFGANAVFLNFALDWASKYNLNINQTNVANVLIGSFNTNGSYPGRLRFAHTSRPYPGLRRNSNRNAAGHLRCDEPVSECADRSVHQRARRSRFGFRRRDAVCRRRRRQRLCCQKAN